MIKKLLPVLLVIIALVAAACGSVATPAWEGGAEIVSEANAAEGIEVAQLATEEAAEPTEIPPTQEPTTAPTSTATPIPSPTPIPSTATFTPIPPTGAPTAVPTQPDVAAPSDAGSSSAAASGTGNAAAGEQLFVAGNGMAAPCSSCHMPNSDMTLVGPGMLGLGQRAGSRVPGQSAEEYLHNSILHPNDFIVQGFAAGLMPQNYVDTLSEAEINDLVAYLLTL